MSRNDYPDDATPEEIAYWKRQDAAAEPPGEDGITLRQVAAMMPDEDYLRLYLGQHPDGVGLMLDLIPKLKPDQVSYVKRVTDQLNYMRARDEAKRIYDGESGIRVDIPSLTHLSDFLDEPDEEVAYRVDRLWPSGGRVVFAAAQKAGKTTVTGNLARALADGEPFLDEFFTAQADRIVLVDNELSPGMWRRWLRDQDIGKVDSVDLLSLRGRLSSFNILDPGVRSRWAEALGSADVLVFDCLRPALDALGLSEDKDAGRFLEALDELVREAGISELLVVHHMGHSNERSRGDSRILDWPDAVWSLVREDPDDPVSRRYFKAYGRDVEHPESRLTYDPETRHLSLGGGSRKQERGFRFQAEVLAFVGENPGCTKTAIEEGIAGKNDPIREARDRLTDTGQLVARQRGRGTYYWLAGEDSNED